jgi:hypothetical protein
MGSSVEVMVSMLNSSVVDDEFIFGVMIMNSRSTTLEISMLTITSTDEPMIYNTRGKHANHYPTDE